MDVGRLIAIGAKEDKAVRTNLENRRHTVETPQITPTLHPNLHHGI
jgi:hypothetical protein